MKITICGSTAFADEMESVAKQLQQLGLEVKYVPMTVENTDGTIWHTRDYYRLKKSMPADPKFWEEHTERIQAHFDKVAWSDAILVTNYDKNGIANYIGPNTLMEMGLAFFLKKKIFLLNPVPEVNWKEEILGLRPVVLNGNLEALRA